MFSHPRGLLAVGLLCVCSVSAVQAQEEMVTNPYYKFWANSKPGATAVHLEQTRLSEAEGKMVADGIDEKRIEYKLIEVTPERAVVEAVVTERDFLGYVQAAPTRQIYPAKLKKSHLERIFQPSGEQAATDTLEVEGNELACKTVSGTIKGPNGEQIEYKVWLSDNVPGSIVKLVRTARHNGDRIAETTTTLKSTR